MSDEAPIRLQAPKRPIGLREQTLLEARRTNRIMHHEVAPIIDELLYLRRMFNAGEEPLEIPDLAVFLSPQFEASRALWAQRYMEAAAGMAVGQNVEFVFGGHSYKLTKQVQ